MTDVALGGCETHRDREAVARCESCGRGACVTCAVPVRARVLCRSCAAREIGEPALERPPREPSRGAAVLAAGLLVLAIAATIPPWDRFGPASTFLSAWRPSPSPWPLLAGLALVGATAFAWITLRRSVLEGWRSGAHAAFASVATAATLWQVFAAPDYVSHTPAPYVVIACAASSAALAAARVVRSR